MTSEAKHNLKTILRPYLFILKEGGKIKNNLLDYSLMMLLINSSETIKSPAIKKNIVTKSVSKMEINIHSTPTILGNNKVNE